MPSPDVTLLTPDAARCILALLDNGGFDPDDTLSSTEVEGLRSLCENIIGVVHGFTAGGQLYGYTPTEMRPHTVEDHDGPMSEAEHLADHANDRRHRHPRTETGALALLSRET